jgi:hypothetical protein
MIVFLLIRWDQMLLLPRERQFGVVCDALARRFEPAIQMGKAELSF